MKDDLGRAYWDRHARNYDRSMVFLGAPMPAMIHHVRRAVHGMANVFEVGAGTGLVTLAIADVAKSVIATDYAREWSNDSARS